MVVRGQFCRVGDTVRDMEPRRSGPGLPTDHACASPHRQQRDHPDRLRPTAPDTPSQRGTSPAAAPARRLLVTSCCTVNRDEQRILEELAGAKRPDRPRSLSGVYLDMAVDALQASATALAVYGGDNVPKPGSRTEMFVYALGREKRVRYLMQGVLFSALAAESYVNEFLAVRLSGKDLSAADRMSPVDKFVLGTKLAYGESLFFRDREPIPDLVALFALRNRLAHPKPGFGLDPMFDDGDRPFETQFSSSSVAQYIVGVAGGAVVLIRRAYGMDTRDIPAEVLWFGRDAVYDFARSHSEPPKPGEEKPDEIYALAADRLSAIVQASKSNRGSQ